MAEPEERSLDDFFAKRDKKKKKEKGSAAASSAAPSRGAARPPEGSQSSLVSLSGGGAKSVRKDKAGRGEATERQLQERKEDDNWKEFEQKEIDYSGLRLHSLQISNEKDDDDNEKKEDQGIDWEETGGSGTEKSQGPWNKTASAQPTMNLVTEIEEPAQPSGVYRPPAARVSATTRKPQGPPEIFSDSQFPSLQATAKHIESRRDKEMEKTFEIVKHKNRAREEAAKNPALRLQLDNQYAVLGEQ